MNILIIGGSNFIGWRLVQLLSKTDHKITILNRGNHGRNYPTNSEHVIADRNNIDEMRTALKNKSYDVVFDMCAFTAENIKPCVEIFNGKIDRYVFISSSAVYLEPLELPINEDFPKGSHKIWGKYGGDKYECENVLMNAYKSYCFPYTIIRPSYVYGKGNPIDRETLLFDRISKSRTILLPGSGDSVIQLGCVDDLCNALLLLIESKCGIGEAYNISSDEYITLSGLIKLVGSIMNADPSFFSINPKEYGFTDRDIFPFDNCTYFTTSEKFKKDFGWKSDISLRQGLTECYTYWLSSENRIKTKYDKEDIVLDDLRKKGYENL